MREARSVMFGNAIVSVYEPKQNTTESGGISPDRKAGCESSLLNRVVPRVVYGRKELGSQRNANMGGSL
jgi:hypothetical protein